MKNKYCFSLGPNPPTRFDSSIRIFYPEKENVHENYTFTNIKVEQNNYI